MTTTSKCGKEVATLEEAEAFLKHFIQRNRAKGTTGFDVHNQDFDLFLPWVLECVQSDAGKSVLSPSELNEIYMDAAWSLVMKGLLRPGPRSCSGSSVGTAYGKGYSLTRAGRLWISSPEPSGLV